jgi:hypothetical protein
MTLNDILESGILKGNLKISIYTDEESWGKPVADTHNIGDNFVSLSDLMENAAKIPMDQKYLGYEIKDLYGHGINSIHIRLIEKGEK